MRKENIDILNNMELDILVRKAIIDEIIDVLEEKNFLYYQGMYIGYINLLFMMNYISNEEANSLNAEID